MKNSLRTGITFGLTSAVITTLGLMVGLKSGTCSTKVVLGGIITIAIADAFSDAVGIHVSEESKNMHGNKHIWIATIATFLSKFLFALTFAIPVLLLSLQTAIVVSIIWGITILSILSYAIAKAQGSSPWRAILEHVFIAIAVIITTHFIGGWIGAPD
jgi:vacuolar iron transporter family protein